MSAENIWKKLKSYGFTDAGCAGVLGNAQAESALRSNNLQDSGNSKLGMTDEEYTRAVDNGSYQRFSGDRHGFGLFQWTTDLRKKNLLDFARKERTSVGDEDMQIDFFVDELIREFHSVYKTLTTTHSVREASDAMLLQYEQPYNQTTENQERRAEMSQAWYDKYHKEEVKAVEKILFEETIGAYNVKLVLIQERIVKEEEKPKTQTVIYTVKRGDSLSAIAKNHNTTVDAIVNENKEKYPKISRSYIEIGWKLSITTDV